MDARRLTATLLAIPLLGLLACGSSDPADPATSSPLPTPSSSSPTHRPPKPETAEHFIRRWSEAEKVMENTGEVREYLALTRGCAGCEGLAKLVTRYYSHGGYLRWGGRRITSIRKYPAPRRHVAFAVRSISAPTRYRVSAESPVKRYPGGPITYALTLLPVHSSFVVTSKVQLAQ